MKSILACQQNQLYIKVSLYNKTLQCFRTRSECDWQRNRTTEPNTSYMYNVYFLWLHTNILCWSFVFHAHYFDFRWNQRGKKSNQINRKAQLKMNSKRVFPTHLLWWPFIGSWPTSIITWPTVLHESFTIPFYIPNKCQFEQIARSISEDWNYRERKRCLGKFVYVKKICIYINAKLQVRISAVGTGEKRTSRFLVRKTKT